jgi:hypothetical protein
MILLEVNFPRLPIAPLERDAPGTVDMKTVPARLTAQEMEIEARDTQIAQRHRLFQRIQSSKCPALKARCNF